ncbi:probable RNA helicase armi [Phymastichus coffea]|uniref:probable RNA helicase armi n=1 Tax=Phymastichus coffea TaxID=108790 RepID=UPI00273AF530|nr:probable RNA helicase armi [Phymastichus coffea]
MNQCNDSDNVNKFHAPDNEEDLIAKIDQAQENIEENITELRVNDIEYDKGCFYKSGFITDISGDHVMIDEDYFCETKDIVPTDLKVRDEVYYMAYKKNKDSDIKIRKILYKIETTWDIDDEETPINYSLPQNFNAKHEDTSQQRLDFNHKVVIVRDKINSEKTVPTVPQIKQVIEKKDISTNIVIGKIIERKGREIFIQDSACKMICVNLDNVKSEFVPFIGDWVKLECLCEVNEDIINWQGEILEVEEMKPLRSLQKIGKVTEYNEESESGMIEKTIVFVKSVCLPGYVPRAGDKVVVYCIESDQGIGQRWRAVQVVPMEDVSQRYETSTVKFKPQMSVEELEEMVRDKENMEITNNIKVNLDVKSVKIIEVTVKNNGNFKQTLYKCAFLSKKSDSQLTLLNPVDNAPLEIQEPQDLKPSNSVTFRFKCKARFVGVSEELIIFKFKKFKIGRIVVITVDSIQSKTPMLQELSNTYTNNYKHKYELPHVYEDGMYVKGVKPFTTARFIQERPMTWKIPDILWIIMNEIHEERMNQSEAEFILADRIPCLQQHLTAENYKQRFNYLLYLEEIAQIFNIRRFNMPSAIMHRSGEFLTLNVPGLAEKRPSLIIGDRILVSFKWDETNGQKCYEGYIHKVKSSDVFLKFNLSFHDNYHGEDCQISFKASTTVLQRCHTAINLAINRLGPGFLFPKRVIQQEPQFNFIDLEEDNANLLSNKRINWFNKRLNVYQKEAVKNILKGVGRPLPYVIFGPPGTGKTITVCESILQIVFTMSDSRILVCTPSNSSANLIAERLLKSKRLQSGDLVRLVAYHYLESELIPEILIPYCATADIAAEGTRPDVNIRDARGYQKNVTLSVLCRSRIIVGTCSAVGILHNMGCKPGHFTHVVIDEAGQATEPELMIPLVLIHTSSTQVILAGDPKQLGPVNQSKYAGYFGLNDSFLVRLLQQFPYQRDPVGFETGYDPRLVTKLLMNYRSLPDLLELPNKLFYENELIPQIHESDSEEAELLKSLEDMLPKRLGDPLPIVFRAVDGKNMQDPDSPSWYNNAEATQVCLYLMEFYNCGLSCSDVGIITPYSKQVYIIKNMLADFDLEIPKVGSVEEFQGQERKVIILSTVRTAENKVKEDIRHALGFVSARERLNVAITRARALLVIIGNPKLLEQDVYWRSVLQHCKTRNAYVANKLA